MRTAIDILASVAIVYVLAVACMTGLHFFGMGAVSARVQRTVRVAGGVAAVIALVAAALMAHWQR